MSTVGLDWEEVDGQEVHRAWIRGGWLVKLFEQIYNAQMDRWEWRAVGITSASDPEKRWVLDEAPEADLAPTPPPEPAPEPPGSE